MDTSKLEIITTGIEDIKGPKAAFMADIITRHVTFARDESRNLYYYDNGVYHSEGEQIVRELVLKILRQWSKLADWSLRLENNVIGCIRILSPILWERPPLYKVNLLNGIYDVELNEIFPHSSEWLSTIQIPIIFDREATSDHWPKFLSSLFPQGEDLLLQMIAWFMVPHTKLQKAVLILGEGSNGKGTFLRMVDKIIGIKNICHASLHQLENERFSRGVIVNKLVNSCGDLPIHEIKNLNLLKSLVGEDAIQIEYKGCQPFSYNPFCRLIFSSNKLPSTNDDTEGYKRRWLILPFTQTFQVSPTKSQELEYDLAEPRELSGLLNLVLPWLSSILESGFEISSEVAAIISNYSPIPENVKIYFEKYILENESGIIPSNTLYNHFVRYLWGLPGEEGFTRSGLITLVRNRYPSVQVNKSVRVDGKVTKCYKGISLRGLTISHEEISDLESKNLDGTGQVM